METCNVVLNLRMNQEEKEVSSYVLVTEKDGIWSLVAQAGAAEETLYTGEDASMVRKLLALHLREKESHGWKAVFPLKLGVPSTGALLTSMDYYSDFHFNEECYEELRRWRWNKAKELQVSAFIIATNRALKQLSTFLPQSEEQLEEIRTLGPKQRSKHGTDLLAITTQYECPYEYPLSWVNDQVDSAELQRWREEQEERKASEAKERAEQEQRERAALLQMIADGQRLQEICKAFGKAPSTMLKRVERLAEDGYELQSWFQQEVKPIEQAQEILAVAEERGTNFAKPVFEALYESANLDSNTKRQRYNEIRVVLSYLRWSNLIVKPKAVMVS